MLKHIKSCNVMTCKFVLQSQIIEFQWADIRQWEADEEGMSFNFEYVRTGKKPRWVKVFTSYVSFSSACFISILLVNFVLDRYIFINCEI